MDGVNLRYIVKVAIGIFTANDFPFGIASWSISLWFCYSLFLVRLLYAYLSERRWGGQFIILTCLIGVVMMFLGNKLPMRLDSSLVGFIFFTIGVKGSEVLKSVIDYSLKKKLFFLLLALLVLYVSAYLNLNLQQRQGLSINVMYFGKYPLLFLISGFSGTMVILLISTFFSGFKNKVVLTISNGTIVILGFHWLVYKLLFSWWFSSYKVLSAIFVSVLVTFVCYTLIILSNKFFPALLGNRRI